MKELTLDKIPEVEAALKKHLSLFQLFVMLYWRYTKPYKALYIYRFAYMCSTQERNFKLTTDAESVLHIYAVRRS